MQDKLQKAWFSNQKWVWILFPLTLLFFLVSYLRRKFYSFGWLASNGSNIPVIIVGNIGIGGNGKTPVVLSLVSWLQQNGYIPVVLSRGYGGQCKQFPYLLQNNDKPDLVGDEPALINNRALCEVVIDPNRGRAAHYIERNLKCDVIICDDGMQHYALKRDIELCVVDKRGLGNGFLLPMGPLREGAWRLNTVSAIIENKGVASEIDELQNNKPNWFPKMCDTPYFGANLVPTYWINVHTKEKVAIDDFSSYLNDQNILAMAGIGDPQRFFDTLISLGITATEQKGYPDHYQYLSHDIPKNKLILMTEKDAVKCTEFAHKHCWYLVIETNLNDEFFHFVEKKLATNKK